MPEIVYLNGRYLNLDEAMVPVTDRGFLFGDGVYEVIMCYNNQLFEFEPHIKRLERSLQTIHLPLDLDAVGWRNILETLVARNGGGDKLLYLQVTRGSTPERKHTFPENPQPTRFVRCSPHQPHTKDELRQGISAITSEELRWDWCYVKSTNLLPNILLRQEAVNRGAQEAILIRDHYVIEGASSNLFIVKDGTIKTPPKEQGMLEGITRNLVIKLAQSHAIPLLETPISTTELAQADEIWITSSTRSIMPVLHLDSQPVGNAKAGPLWEILIDLFLQYAKPA